MSNNNFEANRKELEKMKLINEVDKSDCKGNKCIDCAKCIKPEKTKNFYRYPQMMKSNYQGDFAKG